MALQPGIDRTDCIAECGTDRYRRTQGLAAQVAQCVSSDCHDHANKTNQHPCDAGKGQALFRQKHRGDQNAEHRNRGKQDAAETASDVQLPPGNGDVGEGRREDTKHDDRQPRSAKYREALAG